MPPCSKCAEPVARRQASYCKACRVAREIDRWRQKNRQRRAQLRAAVSESYTLAEIAERDGHRCQLCRRKVDMDLKAPHPRSPSIDHIVPLVKGGDDTRANVQLAHRRCNTSKGTRVADVQQLALVG